LAIPVTPDSDASANAEAEARAEINKKMSDAWSHMHFSLAWLQVESREVAERYEELVTKARKAEPQLRQKAWEENLDNVQSETTLSGRYPFEDIDSWKACVVEMRGCTAADLASVASSTDEEAEHEARIHATIRTRVS
jgi:hypothetical protein